MKSLETILIEQIKNAGKSLFNIEVDPNLIQLQETKKEFQGDITFVVFPFTKVIKSSPETIAESVGSYLKLHSEIVGSYQIVKGFLNLSIKDSFWLNYFRAQQEPALSPATGKTFMVEYSSPNTNKPLHLGHVRNNLLGYSVAEILRENGHNILKANLINDRGIHICKSMLAWKRWGNGEVPSAIKKGDHLVGDYYVLFDKEYKKEIEALKAQGKSEEEAKKTAPLILEAQQMLLDWENNVPEVIELWKTMNGWVYDGFDITYKKMGVDFDKFYYESQTYLLGKEIVEEGLSKGVFYKKEDGSVWIDLTAEGLDNKLVLRADGTSVYITQDIGTAQQRFEQNHINKLIYVVGNEQEYHFKVLQLILKKLGRSWADDIFHLSYGMVDLPSGKMKSREGTVVDADELIEEMVNTAKETTLELGKTADFEEAEAQELYNSIGMGALKYFILKVDPKKRMLFNPAESIDFNGNTGPFIQYTYARIKSVLRKADVMPAKEGVKVLEEKEKDIIKLVYQYPVILAEAGSLLAPSVIANYSYQLAKAFNQFYHELPILQASDKQLIAFRLALAEQTAQILKKSMSLLGIQMVERM